jgi:hypothetical protein
MFPTCSWPPPSPQVGIPCTVLERGPQLRAQGSAIGVWANAWRALDVLGVGEALRQGYPLLDRCVVCLQCCGAHVDAILFCVCGVYIRRGRRPRPIDGSTQAEEQQHTWGAIHSG